MAVDIWNYAGIPENALEVLTPEMREKLEAKIKYGTNREAAKALNTSESYMTNCMYTIRTRLRKHGYDQETGSEIVIGNPHHVKGRSQYFNVDPNTGERNLVREWVKTDTDKEKTNEAYKEFISNLKSESPTFKKSKFKKTKKPENIMPTIVIGDAHIGAYAYGVETRNRDFDTDKAAQEIRDAIDNLVERSPEADTAILVNVGDYLHSDTSRGETWSGTRLDHDTRRKRVLGIAGRVFRYGIDRMLQKFNKVVVVNARGNHDDNSSLGISVVLETAYEKEPRVNVLETEGYFHYLEYGKWLIGVHHGDKVKGQRLPGLMAKTLPESWGRTTHRIWILGHFHHKKTEEMDGCVVRTFGTLAPPDSWHSSMGFGSESSMELIVFRKEGGVHSELVYSMPPVKNEPDASIT